MEKEKDKKILWRPVYNCNSCDQNNIWIYHQQSNSFFFLSLYTFFSPHSSYSNRKKEEEER